MILHLVRHGRPLIDRSVPAHRWPLDPAYDDEVRALRPRLPAKARWYSSPEPKALGTARLLADGPVIVVEDLREHVRACADWIDDFETTVARAFARPDEPASDGWEPLAVCTRRVVAAVAALGVGGDDDVVLVGHGTAWTALVAALTGAPPDLARWRRLALPDRFCEIRVVPGDTLAP
ncbi:MAG: histidine phosphatase family protein [Nocardioides sp.]